MSPQLHVLIVVGSLRSGSFNMMLARAAAGMLPEGVTASLADVGQIPPFSEDLRDLEGVPDAVSDLRSEMRNAGAVLVVSPEYNYSIPGVLKNAIDWVSDGSDHPFKGKPMAIMGASTGRFGTVRMQAHLRDVLSGLGAAVLPKPEVTIASAREKFGEDGDLVDERSRRQVRELIVALADWSARVCGA
jgi:chromate reductase